MPQVYGAGFDPRMDRRVGSPEGLPRRVSEMERRIGGREVRGRYMWQADPATWDTNIPVTEVLVPECSHTWDSSGRAVFVDYWVTIQNNTDGLSRDIWIVPRVSAGGAILPYNDGNAVATTTVTGAFGKRTISGSFIFFPDPGSRTINLYMSASGSGAIIWQARRGMCLFEL
jgi:hypothetical protein